MDSENLQNRIEKDILILENNEVKTDWQSKSQWRRDNRCWLHYSGVIALKIIHRLKETGISKRELASKMGCSPQYVSKLVKGSENLTLETIARLENVLKIDIIKSALTNVDGYVMLSSSKQQYLSEP
jgi:ribosome-binding protein aMBF1 (putative translation factor)